MQSPKRSSLSEDSFRSSTSSFEIYDEAAEAAAQMQETAAALDTVSLNDVETYSNPDSDNRIEKQYDLLGDAGEEEEEKESEDFDDKEDKEKDEKKEEDDEVEDEEDDDTVSMPESFHECGPHPVPKGRPMFPGYGKMDMFEFIFEYFENLKTQMERYIHQQEVTHDLEEVDRLVAGKSWSKMDYQLEFDIFDYEHLVQHLHDIEKHLKIKKASMDEENRKRASEGKILRDPTYLKSLYRKEIPKPKSVEEKPQEKAAPMVECLNCGMNSVTKIEDTKEYKEMEEQYIEKQEELLEQLLTGAQKHRIEIAEQKAIIRKLEQKVLNMAREQNDNRCSEVLGHYPETEEPQKPSLDLTALIANMNNKHQEEIRKLTSKLAMTSDALNKFSVTKFAEINQLHQSYQKLIDENEKRVIEERLQLQNDFDAGVDRELVRLVKLFADQIHDAKNEEQAKFRLFRAQKEKELEELRKELHSTRMELEELKPATTVDLEERMKPLIDERKWLEDLQEKLNLEIRQGGKELKMHLEKQQLEREQSIRKLEEFLKNGSDARARELTQSCKKAFCEIWENDQMDNKIAEIAQKQIKLELEQAKMEQKQLIDIEIFIDDENYSNVVQIEQNQNEKEPEQREMEQQQSTAEKNENCDEEKQELSTSEDLKEITEKKKKYKIKYLNLKNEYEAKIEHFTKLLECKDSEIKTLKARLNSTWYPKMMSH